MDSISNCILHLPIPLSKIEEIDNHNSQQVIIPYDPLIINNQKELDDSINTCMYSNIENSNDMLNLYQSIKRCIFGETEKNWLDTAVRACLPGTGQNLCILLNVLHLGSRDAFLT